MRTKWDLFVEQVSLVPLDAYSVQSEWQATLCECSIIFVRGTIGSKMGLYLWSLYLLCT